MDDDWISITQMEAMKSFSASAADAATTMQAISRAYSMREISRALAEARAAVQPYTGFKQYSVVVLEGRVDGADARITVVSHETLGSDGTRWWRCRVIGRVPGSLGRVDGLSQGVNHRQLAEHLQFGNDVVTDLLQRGWRLSK